MYNLKNDTEENNEREKSGGKENEVTNNTKGKAIKNKEKKLKMPLSLHERQRTFARYQHLENPKQYIILEIVIHKGINTTR